MPKKQVSASQQERHAIYYCGVKIEIYINNGRLNTKDMADMKEEIKALLEKYTTPILETGGYKACLQENL